MVAEPEGGYHGRDLASSLEGRKSSAEIVTLVATFFLLFFLFSQSECSSLMQPALSRSRPRYLLLCLSDDGARKPVCSVTLLQAALATTAEPNAQRQHIRAREIWEGGRKRGPVGGE